MYFLITAAWNIYSPEFEAYGTLKPYFLRTIFTSKLVPAFIMTWAILVIFHYKCMSSIYIVYLAFPAVNSGSLVCEAMVMKQRLGELGNTGWWLDLATVISVFQTCLLLEFGIHFTVLSSLSCFCSLTNFFFLVIHLPCATFRFLSRFLFLENMLVCGRQRVPVLCNSLLPFSVTGQREWCFNPVSDCQQLLWY